MRHILRLSGRFLAAMLLIAAGLGSFGCGDSATVNPVVELRSLTVSPGTLQPGFSGGTTRYNVDLASSTTSVTVTAQAAVSGDTVSIDGEPRTSHTVALGAPGSTTPVSIVVSESGTNSRTYTVLLKRAALAGNNSLQGLTVSPGTPPIAFNENTLTYTVDVASTVGSVEVTPTLQDSAATMTVKKENGQAEAATSDQPQTITLNPAGQRTLITIEVTAQDLTKKSYTILVNRGGLSGNNSLENLAVSPGTPPIAFNINTLTYTVDVASTVRSVNVTPTVQDSNATMTVNGQAATSAQARRVDLDPAGQRTLITIEVTAQDLTKKSYSILVNRAGLLGINTLQSLTVTSGTGTTNLISFSPTTPSYSVNVASTVTSVTVRPTLPSNSSASMSIRVNSGTPTNISSGQSRSIPLGAPDSITFINIIVTAQNSSQKTYVVAVDKAPSNDNNLSALSVRVGNTPQTLSPRFARNIASYTVDVASNVTRVTVSATKADRFAAMAIGSVTVGSGTETGQADISLGGQGSETPVSITVTPQIGNPKTYSLTITRLSSNTNLSALSVTAGAAVLPLSPPFDDPKKNTVSVATDVTTVTVTATLQDTNATMTINGQGISSGVPSAPITLEGPPPSNTSIPIVVIAPNGNRKDYTITVNRAAPTAPQTPTVAPDLIEEDDSCPLIFPNNPNQCVVGSRNDNITNVTTPRFRIPQPGVGETPTLYSGKDQVPANFNQGDNTLQPTSALSDGEHSISYTLSNAGSESGKSPALTVTIDSAPPGNPGGG